MGLEKYRELYALSIKLLEAEHGRFNRISQKATAYLSVVGLLFGIATVFGKALIEGFIPPKSLLEWVILNLGVLIFISLGVAWWMIFRAYKFEGLLTPPQSELIDFYHKNKLIDIYFAMARAYANATKENINVTNRKAILLEQGHNMILLTASLSMAFALLYFAYLWRSPPAQTSYQSVQQVTNNQKADQSGHQLSGTTNKTVAQPSSPQTSNFAAPNQLAPGGTRTTNSP